MFAPTKNELGTWNEGFSQARAVTRILANASDAANFFTVLDTSYANLFPYVSIFSIGSFVRILRGAELRPF